MDNIVIIHDSVKQTKNVEDVSYWYVVITPKENAQLCLSSFPKWSAFVYNCTHRITAPLWTPINDQTQTLNALQYHSSQFRIIISMILFFQFAFTRTRRASCHDQHAVDCTAIRKGSVKVSHTGIFLFHFDSHPSLHQHTQLPIPTHHTVSAVRSIILFISYVIHIHLNHHQYRFWSVPWPAGSGGRAWGRIQQRTSFSLFCRRPSSAGPAWAAMSIL